jgi:hypothetical protein
MVGQKNAMPYDCPPQMANSSWLSNQGQNLAHSKNFLKKHSQEFIAMAILPWSNFKKLDYKTYIHNIDM